MSCEDRWAPFEAARKPSLDQSYYTQVGKVADQIIGATTASPVFTDYAKLKAERDNQVVTIVQLKAIVEARDSRVRELERLLDKTNVALSEGDAVIRKINEQYGRRLSERDEIITRLGGDNNHLTHEVSRFKAALSDRDGAVSRHGRRLKEYASVVAAMNVECDELVRQNRRHIKKIKRLKRARLVPMLIVGPPGPQGAMGSPGRDA